MRMKRQNENTNLHGAGRLVDNVQDNGLGVAGQIAAWLQLHLGQLIQTGDLFQGRGG